MTTPQVAEKINASRQYVWKMLIDGHFPNTRSNGGRYFIDPVDVEIFLESDTYKNFVAIKSKTKPRSTGRKKKKPEGLEERERIRASKFFKNKK